MSNRVSSDVSFKDVLDEHKKDIFRDMNCHSIGTVEEFDSSQQTCKVKINYLKTRLVKNQFGVYTERNFSYPLLIDCPIMVYKGGVSGLTMPISAGDSCLVLFNDRDIDNWFSGANSAPVSTSRMHSISDGIVFVGLNSKATLIQGYDAENPVLYNGQSKITVKSDKLVLENATNKLGELMVELIDAINAITSTNAVPGSPVALSPASQVQFNLIKAKFEGLLE